MKGNEDEFSNDIAHKNKSDFSVTKEIFMNHCTPTSDDKNTVAHNLSKISAQC